MKWLADVLLNALLRLVFRLVWLLATLAERLSACGAKEAIFDRREKTA